MPTATVKLFSNYVKDLTGKKFGRLTVVGFSHLTKWRDACWTCRCSCGKTTAVRGCHLRAGNTGSCGCWQHETRIKNGHEYGYFKHGHTAGRTESAEYKCWSSMKNRCYNKNDRRYKDYGGRGITICKRWLNSFEDFYSDVGPRPGPGYSLDRISNNGNYCRSNIRWATRKQQQRNQRSNRLIEFQNERLCVAEWAERLGLTHSIILSRLNRGWSVEKTLTIPSRGPKPDSPRAVSN